MHLKRFQLPAIYEQIRFTITLLTDLAHLSSLVLTKLI